MGHKVKEISHPIKAGSTADDIALLVKGILSSQFVVKSISIDADRIKWEIYVPDTTPPYGTLQEPKPKGVASLLSGIEMEEISGTRVNMNLKPFGVVVGMLLFSRKKKVDGIVTGYIGNAWIVGDLKNFCEWLGIKSDPLPTKFLNMPLIESKDIPEDRIVLTCARSSSSDYLDSEYCVVSVMAKKEK